jgi:hypothetical protein
VRLSEHVWTRQFTGANVTVDAEATSCERAARHLGG